VVVGVQCALHKHRGGGGGGCGCTPCQHARGYAPSKHDCKREAAVVVARVGECASMTLRVGVSSDGGHVRARLRGGDGEGGCTPHKHGSRLQPT
jgi:hypothetical protein